MSCLICEQDIEVDVEDTKRHLVVSPESAMFCAHLSHFGMLYNCYQDNFFLLGM